MTDEAARPSRSAIADPAPATHRGAIVPDAPAELAFARAGRLDVRAVPRQLDAPAFLLERADRRVVDANGAAAALLGEDAAAFSGQVLDDVLLRHGAVAGSDTAAGLLEGGEISLPDAAADGRSRAYGLSLVPLRFGDREMALCVMHEVTRWVDREAELSRANLALSRMARRDHLTGLFNKPMFLDTLALAGSRLERTGRMLAVLYIDLDGFKPVNDRFGHDAGDRMLVEIADRLRRAVRASDVVARLGGDEFGAILENLRHAEDARKVARHIVERIAAPLEVEGTAIVISASIGAVVIDRMVADGAGLLQQADWQMYRAKTAGRGQVSVAVAAARDAGRDAAPGG